MRQRHRPSEQNAVKVFFERSAISLATYNAAVREICVGLATSDPRDCASQLKDLGIVLVLRPWEKAGIPVVLRYAV